MVPGLQEAESNLPQKLSKPALRALRGAGFDRLEKLANAKESDLIKLHGMGPKAMEQLRGALHARGLSFAEES